MNWNPFVRKEKDKKGEKKIYCLCCGNPDAKVEVWPTYEIEERQAMVFQAVTSCNRCGWDGNHVFAKPKNNISKEEALKPNE